MRGPTVNRVGGVPAPGVSGKDMKRAVKGFQRAAGTLQDKTPKLIKRAFDPANLAGKIGDMGGIKYHGLRNLATGVTAKVRGNPKKQSKIPGFNAPNFAALKEGNLAAGKLTGRAKGLAVVGNFIKNAIGARYGRQVRQ